MTPERIAELRRLLAMSEHWELIEYRPVGWGARIVNPPGDAEMGTWTVADFALIEHAKAVLAFVKGLPEALDEIERLRAELSKVGEFLKTNHMHFSWSTDAALSPPEKRPRR